MSYLSELITELCPDGVEYRSLGELVRIRNGRDYKTLSSGIVPVYGSGGVMTHVSEALGVGPTVLIPRKGSLDNIFLWRGNFGLSIRFSTQKLVQNLSQSSFITI